MRIKCILTGVVSLLAACSRITDPAVKGNVDMLRDGNPAIQLQAIEFFSRMGPLAADAMDSVMDVAGSRTGDPSVRSAAILALPQMNPDGRTVLPFLRQHLRHPDAQIRIASLQAIGALGEVASPAADDVAARLKEDNELVVVAAIYATAKIQPNERHTAALYELLEVKSPEARIIALRALGELSQAFQIRLEPMRRALRDENAEVQTQAVRTVGRFGAAASDLISVLQELLQRQDRAGEATEGRGILIMGALWRIDPSGMRIQDVIAACLLACRSDKLRMTASMTLPKSKTVGPASVNALLRAARFDPDSGVRQSSVEGLGKVEMTETIERTLITILVSERAPAVSWKAAEVLGKMKKPPRTELLALSGTVDAGLRERSNYALKLAGESASKKGGAALQ